MTCFYGGRGRRLRNVRRLVAFCRDKKRKQIERGGDSNEKATSSQDGNAGADKWVDLTLMSGLTPAACFTMGASVLAQAILTYVPAFVAAPSTRRESTTLNLTSWELP